MGWRVKVILKLVKVFFYKFYLFIRENEGNKYKVGWEFDFMLVDVLKWENFFLIVKINIK